MLNIREKLKDLENINLLDILFNLLNAHGEARLVGGCVRDMLLGKAVQDIDIAVNLKPHIVMDILKEGGIKSIPTGLQFGTITALISNQSFQITTLRQDITCYGRKAEVAFSTSWEEDAKRRDFTFNALYADLDGNIYDYCDGIADLEKNMVRFIGDPKKRIKEDYLRILRYFRFLSYIGMHKIDEASLSAIKELAHSLSLISGERIQVEMLKLLSNKFAQEAYILLYCTKVHEHIALPVSQANLDGLNMILAEPLVNLAAILKISNASNLEITALAHRWKLSNKDYSLLRKLCLVENNFHIKASMAEHKRHCYLLGKDLYLRQILLYFAMRKYEQLEKALLALEELQQWKEPILPISGADLLPLGLEGKDIGDALSFLKEKWVSSDFQLTKQQLLQSITTANLN